MRKKAFAKRPARPGSKNNKKAASTFILLICLCAAALFLIRQLDRIILPPVLAVAETKAKTQINTAIAGAVGQVLRERNISTEDFFRKQENADGKVTSMSVNTVLVNEICSQIAVQISAELNSIENQRVRIPMGSMLGVQLFANTGPSYNFSLLPAGDTTVDYRTKMDSAGINQIHFQVWLDVTSSVRIVNPLQQNKITISRNVPLISAVLSEDVPNAYWNPMTPASAN
ncbi:MAG: sporulation protein YunB [Clostridiales bacterium]|nr:sporulation protein YunB [Clostridiales bacterium]